MSTPTPGKIDDTASYSDEQLQSLAAKSKKEDFENRVIAWTRGAHQRCRAMRQQMERQWYLNLAFYSGLQNVVPVNVQGSSNTGVRLYVPPAPYYRARPTINRIRPIIRTELSKLLSQKPSASIVPSTGEDQDLAAAQAGEQIWESIYRNRRIPAVFKQTLLWTLTTGNGFLKTYWNPTKRAADGSEGDFCYENVTPFHIFVPDMLAVDIEDQPYVIHIQTKSVEWVRLNYPGLPVEPNVMEAGDLLNDSFLNLVGANDYRKDSVLCYEVWVKPGNVEFLPNGGMFQIVGSKLVAFVEGQPGKWNPYLHQQYPFAKFDHIPTGRFYADSVIKDLVPVQREYNRTRGQIIENKNKLGHLQILAAQGSIDAARITTEPGQVIQYKLGFPEPKPMPLQSLPPFVMEELDRLLMDFEDISGQHQVSKGQVPPGVTAATAISYLQEQDESMLGTTYSSIEEGYEKIAYQTLCYVQQYWTEPRLVKVVGRDGQFNVISFQGSDLRENTDIRVEAGSALPTSKSAKQALLMDLMTQQFIPPEKGLELMDVGGVQRLYDDLQTDSSQASRENMRMAAVTQEMLSEYLMTFVAPPPPPPDPMAVMMGEAPPPEIDPMTGQPIEQAPQLIDPNTGGPLVDQAGNPTEPPLIVPVNSYDNHQVHITVHNNYRKSQQFEMLPKETKDLFEEHVNQHMMMMGMIPGMPAPQDNANAVSSGGFEAGQVTPESLQAVVDPNSAPPPGSPGTPPAPESGGGAPIAEPGPVIPGGE